MFRIQKSSLSTPTLHQVMSLIYCHAKPLLIRWLLNFQPNANITKEMLQSNTMVTALRPVQCGFYQLTTGFKGRYVRGNR